MLRAQAVFPLPGIAQNGREKQALADFLSRRYESGIDNEVNLHNQELERRRRELERLIADLEKKTWKTKNIESKTTCSPSKALTTAHIPGGGCRSSFGSSEKRKSTPSSKSPTRHIPFILNGRRSLSLPQPQHQILTAEI